MIRVILSYVVHGGDKTNTLYKPSRVSIVLINNNLGFTVGYLNQLWNRICRSSVSFDAEATTLLLTFPEAVIGSRSMSRHVNRSQENVKSVQAFSKDISTAVFVYLRLWNGDFNFDVSNAMPSNHARFGVPNTGSYTIFNAGRDCLNFKKSTKLLDVVTDGNMPLRRKLAAGEKTNKCLPGRPKKTMKTYKVKPCRKITKY